MALEIESGSSIMLEFHLVKSLPVITVVNAPIWVIHTPRLFKLMIEHHIATTLRKGEIIVCLATSDAQVSDGNRGYLDEIVEATEHDSGRQHGWQRFNMGLLFLSIDVHRDNVLIEIKRDFKRYPSFIEQPLAIEPTTNQCGLTFLVELDKIISTSIVEDIKVNPFLLVNHMEYIPHLAYSGQQHIELDIQLMKKHLFIVGKHRI